MLDWQPIQTFPFETANCEQFFVVFRKTDWYVDICEARYASPNGGGEPTLCVWQSQDYDSPVLVKAKGYTHWVEITPPS